MKLLSLLLLNAASGMVSYQGGISGTIDHYSTSNYSNDHDETWVVDSDCSNVNLVSTYFDTEESYDVVTIDGNEYHGNDTVVNIDLDLPSSFNVSFTTDYSGVRTGFILEWTGYNCTIGMFGHSGTIEHLNYSINHNEIWEIESTCEDGVHIWSEEFDTEPNYDYVDIEGTQYHGNMTVDQIVNNSFSVDFTSDYMIPDDGFIIHWDCVVIPQTGRSGEIDHMLGNYTNDHYERWDVESSCEDGVTIWSVEFSMEEYSDTVTIEGSEYHGDMQINQVVNNSFSVVFESDGSITDDGFLLKWECVVIPQTGLSGTIDHLLANYSNDHSQQWDIHSDCQDGVRIISTEFKMQEDDDFVTIEGSQYHGDMEVDQVVNNSFSVYFETDDSVTDDGFFLRWMCYSVPQTGLSGTIELHDYENDHAQYWSVESDCSSVRIHSVHFEVEADNDFVNIEGEEYHGNDTVIEQVVDGAFIVTFASDDMVRHTGFVLQWECVTAPSLNNLMSASEFNLIARPNLARKFARIARRVEGSPRCPMDRMDQAAFDAKMVEIWDATDFSEMNSLMQDLITIRFTAVAPSSFRPGCANKMGKVLGTWSKIWNKVQNRPLA